MMTMIPTAEQVSSNTHHSATIYYRMSQKQVDQFSSRMSGTADTQSNAVQQLATTGQTG